MKRVIIYIVLSLLSLGYSHAQDRIPWVLNNGDTLWYKAYWEDQYAVIVPPNSDGYHTGNRKPSGHLSIPDSLPMPWWWCDTTGWEDGTIEGFEQNWRNNAPRIPVLKIGSDAFRNCSDLTCVIIPQEVHTIYATAFLSCTSMSSVTIGESANAIGGSAFRNCTSLTTIVCKAEIPPICSSDPFENVPRYADVIVPCGAAYRYQLTDYWNGFTRITEDCDPSGIEGVDTDNIEVYSNGNLIVVTGATGIIRVMDIMGRIVSETKGEKAIARVPQSGVYIVSIDNNYARKIVVMK